MMGLCSPGIKGQKYWHRIFQNGTYTGGTTNAEAKKHGLAYQEIQYII